MIHRQHLKVYKRTFLSKFFENLRGTPLTTLRFVVSVVCVRSLLLTAKKPALVWISGRDL